VKSADPPETKQMIGTDMILPAASGALFIALCAVLPCRHEGRPLAARRGDRQKPPSDVAWGAPPKKSSNARSKRLPESDRRNVRGRRLRQSPTSRIAQGRHTRQVEHKGSDPRGSQILMAFVIDASATLLALWGRGHTLDRSATRSRGTARRCSRSGALGPRHGERSSVAQRSGRVTDAQVSEFIEDLATLPIRVVPGAAPAQWPAEGGAGPRPRAIVIAVSARRGSCADCGRRTSGRRA